ncbi:AMIN domain-containing protein [Dolichospermum circinale CS-534/05]|uniref:type IV pilus secretin family protein n=1 Tax=Dolichospermum circinale TaxID=109265 RepID=UPI00232FF0B1|nr:type IV pilus secretin family protein [Dolichospermum circinale]MDB9491197.1 AMIN domain-containing protein [Dolichospermum circinale CS-534/05]
MKQSDYRFFVPGAAACILLAAQPVLAKITQVTDVELNPIQGGISVILKTGTENSLQVFSTKKGKSLVADIVNAQLRLPKDGNFRQENPAPGIAVIEVKQLDTNNMQVTVTGTDNAPNIQPVNRRDNNITLGFTTTVANSTTSNSTNSTDKPGQQPEVLVPNPQVTIDGKITQTPNPGQAYKQSPVFLPKAVAPPVGDITQSNIDTSPVVIDLGTKERVRRLVLRDAPVREVLSLLARAAGLNLAYIGGEAEKPQDAENVTKTSQKISLDIENEPVQDVFNYVLRLSGLEANRSGRTIFVGTQLPNSSRNLVMRNLRLNQVTVGVALNFLVALGAESAVSRERLVTSVNAVPVGGAANTAVTQTQTTTETKIETQRITYTDSTPILRGLQASGDERTNSVTLIGSPKMVEMAVSQLTQLDIRRRQVVVNVKIIDVNLTGTQDYNTSFSFGVGNNFFVNDGGAASLNFGGSRPATGSEVANNLSGGTPVTPNPYSGANTFIDLNSSTSIPNTGIGDRVIVDGALVSERQGGTTQFFNRQAGVSQNPFQTGLTNITQGTPNVTTITNIPAVPATPAVIDNNGNIISPAVPGTPARTETTYAPGQLGTVTSALPSLYQFPKRLLASLQAQVTSGNAKILTDPTLIVQEGQNAVVKLTTEVYAGLKTSSQSTGTTSPTTSSTTSSSVSEPIIKEAGLSLNVKVERIDDNGFVSLSVAPTVSAPGGTAQAGGDNGTITLLSERSLASGVLRLRDSQTLILSGIIQDTDRTSVSKLPILGDIPLLGALFRKTNKQNERREVIILLTPQIMDDSQNSGYGYNYTPSPTAREMLERQGVKLQPR